MNVWNQIKVIRESRKIAQIQMAQDLGVSRQTMNAIEKMKYNPSLELTLKIARYFQMSVEEIFKLEEESF
ncbi:helix-turn-helix transcriptional regulator [Enterococcus rivorum]|uniref:Transcriptional regulator n=1 Tax=Enterococcus rivorum TaxID=762845 RepID=A0A1E5KV23_9ENTE|nr:helix-turn-helix transcriptional regulator [Enterococcus rivorum]MBP2100342.1 putative transcriptional regulator [Enterococcus rivorum]OEH81746.1 transcriptional regulator [Enterococcus rivorum]